MASSVALAPLLLIAQAAAPGALGPVRLAPQVAACPAPAEVEAALAQVLGNGQPAHQGWVLSYGRAATEADTDATVWMVLADPAGERVVERRLPASPADCPALAGAMAAVVERALRTPEWTRGEPLPASMPKPDTAAVAPPPAPDHQPTVRPRPPRLVLGAGPLLATSPRAGTNLLLEARVRVSGPLCVRLGGTVLAGSSSESLGTGTAQMSSRYFTLAALAAWMWTRVEGSGGPVLLLSYDQGSGNLAQGGSGARATVAVGATMAIALRLSPRWRLGVGMDGFRTVAGADFFVALDGRTTDVLSPPSWEALGALRLEFLPWP